MPMPWLQASETSRRPADWALTPTIRSRPCSARELSKLELEADAADIDTLLVAVGGGGLIGGIAAWYASRAKIVAVESDGAPTLHAAFKVGGPIDAPTGGIAADSLAPKRVGKLAFSIARQHVAPEVVLVSDAEIKRAQRRFMGSGPYRGRAGRSGGACGSDIRPLPTGLRRARCRARLRRQHDRRRLLELRMIPIRS